MRASRVAIALALLAGSSTLGACQASSMIVNAFKSGAPPKAERRKIDERLAVMERELPAKRVMVLPVAALGKSISYDTAAAAVLAERLVADKTAQATVGAAIELPFTPSTNEVQILWGRLRSLSAYVTAHPVNDADYVLMVDVLGQVGAVHALAVTAKGEMVHRRLWNSHHDLFKQEKPKNNADAARMVAIDFARRIACAQKAEC